jgi:hypothetical protein
MSSDAAPLDPNRLTPAQAAKILSAAGGVRIPLKQIEADLAEGAPTNSDGTVNLVHYTAWLVREVSHAE